ncbi:MAG: T9SS type A sorting domain-containing protein [Gemmatimonadota bacterium]|nr:MAG: T9SS type A sorting domain-containing protein [Gemmatimonadota bacterium]
MSYLKILGGMFALFLALLLSIVSIYSQSSSPDYSIPTSVVAMGGGQGSSASFHGRHSVGQPTVIGNMQSPSYTMFSGFQPTILDEFLLPTAERGDVNGDGTIDVLDVLVTVNHILGTGPLTGDALLRADCNGDWEINVLDALGIVNVILGIGDCSGGGTKLKVTPEAIEFLKGLRTYFSAEDFDCLMALVKGEVEVPTEYSLAQNYPNPFNPNTTIKYALPSGERNTQNGTRTHITLKIYNILGQEIQTLVDEAQKAGYYAVSWNGKDSQGRQVPSGIYFYQMSADGGRWLEAKQMVLLK